MPVDVPTLLTSLRTGRLDMESLGAFPEQDPADRAVGDEWVAQAETFMRRQVDPDDIDSTRELPAGLIDALRREGFLTAAFRTEKKAALSPYNVLRLVTAMATWSVPVAQVVAVHAGVGAGALDPVLPDGPLRELVRDRIGNGVLSGFADTDPAGQNNRLPRMTATRTGDGSAVLLHGEKLYTANGPVAGLLAVSAVLDGQVCVCFVDTASPGFSVESTIEFIGSKGLPSGALRFDGVRVPANRVLSGVDGQLRLPPALNSVAFLGRIYLAGGPAIAIVRNCLAWSRDFVNRRRVDDRPLGDYSRIQRMVAATMADAYAVDSVARWCLVGSGLADRWLERFVAKNVLTRTAWHAADRTVSLLGAEGVETAASKRRRGAVALPVERALRDSRVLRTAGNVDFRLDSQVAQLILAGTHGEGPAVDRVDLGRSATGLSLRNQVHLGAVAEQVRWFAKLCAQTRDTDAVTSGADEHLLVTVGRIAAELVTASVVLSRTAQLDTAEAQDLADVHCTAARHRLTGLWRKLEPDDEPDYRTISRGWLAGSAFEFLGGRHGR
ncbi:alkylation response protein AidB-like acyl-CoA dehydrogenase [Lentzea atacamensis]|uniref:Alkylation response protein AidB-like acyl-CoA dehydrogenase n=1 Tax=Lentzea atacamensis TaxID=531938 RepID=A0ABX9EBA6_9PSEU|nr:acyl-CoA dehydrogenase family protein [Lentzea atacamensis]RAS67444.1 alkylation response protein AidB-like acyl-CoA dehydrogenase [Lentzea atacamensis]